MVYYLDSDFCLHMADDGTMQTWEDEDGFFDGKCQTFVEGYRVVPDRQTWIRKDGRSFKGEMIVPWKNYAILEAVQAEYEKNQADMQAALTEANMTITELDTALLEATYTNLTGGDNLAYN